MATNFSVLIPDGESIFALYAVHCLSMYQNVSIHVLSNRPRPPIRFSHVPKSFTYRKMSDHASRLDAVMDFVKKKKVDILLPTDSASIACVNANKSALESLVALPPLPDTATIAIADNKWLLAKFLEDKHLPGPAVTLVTAGDDFEKRVQAMRYPVMLKPATSRDGDGIEYFQNYSDLAAFFNQYPLQGFVDRYFVQEHFSGPIIGLNILARNGSLLAFTMQQGIIPNKKKYSAAGAIKFLKDDNFFEQARKLVASLNFSGYANVDTILDRENNLNIIDLNARFWGSLRGSLAAGVSFPYLACLAALNIDFPMPDYKLVRYFHPTTGIRQKWLGLLGKARVDAITNEEIGLKFLLTDPLAELLRAKAQ